MAENDDAPGGRGQDLSRRLFLQLGAAAAASNAFAADTPQPIYLSDLRQCLPADAIGPHPRRHHWRWLPYETEKFSGFMLVAGQNTAAPEIRIPLPAKG